MPPSSSEKPPKGEDPKGEGKESRKKRSGFRRFLKWTATLLVLLLLAGAGVVGYGYWKFTKPGPLGEKTTVVIPKGASLDLIAERLAKAKVIDDSLIFRTWVRLHRAQNKLRAGEFEFPRSVSQKAAMRVLISGKMVLRRFSVPEGLTTWEVLERLKSVKGLVGEVTVQPREGELLPDTYYFVFGETRDQMVGRMQQAMQKALDRAWAKRQTDLPLKSKREVLIMASIIEKETGKPGERRQVSSVFANRLRRGMKLQTDPTVIYGITEGKGPLGRRLLRKDLEKAHPYNTYVIVGLPPGPIANPGRRSIMAAVDPDKTKYIYFVADGTGGHAFAISLRDHNRNVRKWRKIRAEREKKGE